MRGLRARIRRTRALHPHRSLSDATVTEGMSSASADAVSLQNTVSAERTAKLEKILCTFTTRTPCLQTKA